MKKVRWFYSDWVIPLSEISSKMLSFQYNENRGIGYIISINNNKVISGKFIEKKVSLEIITDPFGVEKTNNKIFYNITNFTIKNELIGLEIITPPRTIKPFVNNLYKIIGFGFTIEEVNIKPLLWIKAIEKKHECIVNTILASGIKEEKNGVAKISMSGIRDIRKEFYSFVKEKDHNIDCVKLSLILNNKINKLELYKNASLKISLDNYDEIKNIVESSFLSTYNKS